MVSLGTFYNCKSHYYPSINLPRISNLQIVSKSLTSFPQSNQIRSRRGSSSRSQQQLVVRSCSGESQGEEGKSKKTERRTFLTLEEAGLVEISGLDTHERFLCRLTISSLNLLRVIAEQEGCSIEELNAGRVCDWFLKDKLKREQDIDSAVLQWDDSELQF